jgi:cytochrome c-type biogenesis protein CcmH/NrfF
VAPRCSRFGFWFKAAQASLLAVCICFSLGVSDAGTRFNDLGHRLMCTCGCAQMLGECNHVGCPDSGHMRDELTAAIGDGANDEAILTSFATKYGATVLAAPTMHGFDLVGWIAPFAVFAAALLGTILLVRRWSMKPAEADASGTSAPVANLDPAAAELRDRIRRETDLDGGREP